MEVGTINTSATSTNASLSNMLPPLCPPPHSFMNPPPRRQSLYSPSCFNNAINPSLSTCSRSSSLNSNISSTVKLSTGYSSYATPTTMFSLRSPGVLNASKYSTASSLTSSFPTAVSSSSVSYTSASQSSLMLTSGDKHTITASKPKFLADDLNG